MRSSRHVSQRQRPPRDAMRSRRRRCSSSSLLEAPWLFAAGSGERSHDGHAASCRHARAGPRRLKRADGSGRTPSKAAPVTSEKMEMQHHRLMEKLERQAQKDAQAQQTSGGI